MAEKTQIPLKILVDKCRNRVLFAEADYRFVDILCSFLTLPMGKIVRLVRENSDSKIGSLSTLYEGLASLPSECFWTEECCKAMLLNPRSLSDSYCSQLKINVQETIPTQYFMCYCSIYREEVAANFSICNSAKCSCICNSARCGKKLNMAVPHQQKSDVDMDHTNEGTFVNETVNFIITDDLLVKPIVKPNSLDLSIQLLNDLGMKDMTNIEERTMYISLKQVLNLLSLALVSSTPLTNLFLRKKNTIQKLVKCEPSNLTQPRVYKVLEEPTNARGSLKFHAKAFLRRSNGKLLFLHAKGDFIDFLFSFLAIPLGAVERILNGTKFVSIDNFYTSLRNLSVDQHMKPGVVKDILLDPPLPQQYMCKNQLFTLSEPIPLKYYYYRRVGLGGFITPSIPQQFGKYNCLTLKDPMLDGEFVRGAAVFMVTDDLTVTPFSSISTLSYLSKLKVPSSDVEEREVSIGVDEGLEILKASLTSSSALSEGLKHLTRKEAKGTSTKAAYHKMKDELEALYVSYVSFCFGR